MRGEEQRWSFEVGFASYPGELGEGRVGQEAPEQELIHYRFGIFVTITKETMHQPRFKVNDTKLFLTW